MEPAGSTIIESHTTSRPAAVPSRHSIRNLVTRLTILVALAGLGVGGILVVFDEIKQFREDFTEKMVMISNFVGHNMATNISLGDLQAANESLDMLRRMPSVQNVELYDNNGNFFTSLQDDKSSPPQITDTDAVMTSLHGRVLQIITPIFQNGEKYGYIKLTATISEINDKIIHRLVTLLLLAIVLGFAAHFLSRRLQSRITRPILELATTTSNVAASKNYDIRMKTTQTDEIGVLFKSFNTMLGEIAEEKHNINSVLDEVKKSQALFSAVFNASPVGIWMTDEDRIIQLVNPAVLAMFQYSEEEMLGKSTEFLYPSRQGYLEMQHWLRSRIDPKESRKVVEVQYRRKDGSLFWAETLVAGIVMHDDNRISYVGIIRDITDRKRDEQKLLEQRREQQQILDTILDAVISIDQTGRIISFNRSAEKIFGYTADEIIGGSVNRLMPAQFSARHDAAMKEYLRTGVSHAMGLIREFTAMRKSGEEFPIRIAITELPPGPDGMKYFLSTIQDISLIRQQETMISRSQKMDALGKLTGGITHDFNNILNIILGYSQLLQQLLKDNPEQYEYINEIYNAGKLASDLTSRLTAFSRKRPIAAKQVNINQLLNETRLMIEKSLTVSIGLHYDLADDLWPVCIDGTSFIDSVLNLSINAMHAMPDGGSLTFTTRNITLDNAQAQAMGYTLDQDEYVELTVTDTGIGMSQDVQQNIFEPFYTTKGDTGTGLGLSQVYQFVQQSQGAIQVSSRVGQGTSFVLYLPRSHARPEVATVIAEPEAIDYAGGHTVLVVEDEKPLNNLARTILSNNGYTVLTAFNGQEALKVLANNSVDIMLSDIIMPGMNGYQLAELVRQRYPRIKIQLVSGYDNNMDLTSVDSELQRRLLPKPYTSTQLLTSIRQLGH